MMSSEKNKAVVRRFYESFGTNDMTALKKVLAPDLAAYPHSATNPQSRDEVLQTIGMWNAAFSDSHYTIEEQLANGDTVATRVTLQATHNRAEFLGLPPSGKKIKVSGITIERVKDGQIVERRVSYDQMGLMQQLGLVPPPNVGH